MLIVCKKAVKVEFSGGKNVYIINCIFRALAPFSAERMKTYPSYDFMTMKSEYT